MKILPVLTGRLAVVESLITGGDGLTHAANICTATGKTNRPITRLYPLEVNTGQDVSTSEVTDISDPATSSKGCTDPPTLGTQLKRNAAKRAQMQVSEWRKVLRGPPEDIKMMQ